MPNFRVGRARRLWTIHFSNDAKNTNMHPPKGDTISMRTKLILTTLLMLASVGTAQNPVRPDTWEPFKYFVGNWEGTGNGQPGVSKTQREYQFVLNNKFLQVQNKSAYNPRLKNPKGEVHEDW